MASYLERYLQGHHVQVWRELVGLGDQVRSKPYYDDACAVAHETMQRVVRNVTSIHARLCELGYEFQFPEDAVRPPIPPRIEEIAEFEREVGPIPLSLRAWAEVVGSVNFMGNYPNLSFCEAEYHPFAGSQFVVGQNGQTQVMDIAIMMPSKAELDSIPSGYGHALSGILGAFANLTGQHPQADRKAKQAPPEPVHPTEDQDNVRQMENVMQDVLASMQQSFRKAVNPIREQNLEGIPHREQILSDPLVVEFDGLSIEDYESWQELGDEDIPFTIMISQDVSGKANRADGESYVIDLPSAAADGLIRNTEDKDILFVEYLRQSLEWAGFRELRNLPQRDEELLEYLREGLQPF